MSLADLHKISHINSKQFILISGPCAIEGEEMAMRIAEKIKTISDKLSLPYIFKGSFKKANRSRLDSFTGIGDEKALKILEKVGKRFNLPTITDIHQIQDAAMAANYVDIIQIPAFLVRQTDLLIAAAKTNKFINLKKGQFMSPWNMKNSVNKLENFGNNKVILTERGTFFGYNMLVNDMKSLPIMAETGYPTCYDATHSVQLPTSAGNISGGEREFIPFLVRSSIAIGIDALFMEVHDNPKNALSDPNTVLNIKYLDPILRQAKALFETKLKLDNEFGDFKVE